MCEAHPEQDTSRTALATTLALQLLASMQTGKRMELPRPLMFEAEQELVRLGLVVHGKRGLLTTTPIVHESGLDRLLGVLGAGAEAVSPLPIRELAAFAAVCDVHGDIQIASGVDLDVIQALCRCLGEAAERICANRHGDETTIRAAMNDLAGSCLDTGAPPDQIVEWAVAREHGGDRLLYVPADWCWFGGQPNIRGTMARSIGCAAGVTSDAALRAGLSELVERQAVNEWWLMKLETAALLPERDLAIEAIMNAVAALDRKAWWLDISGDGPLAIAVAVSCDQDGAAPSIGYGRGSTRQSAMAAAGLEMCLVENSVRALLAGQAGRDEKSLPARSRAMLAWRSATNAYQDERLAPPRTKAPRRGSFVDTGQLVEQMRVKHGMSIFAVDLARPDLAVSVLRVIATTQFTADPQRLEVSGLLGYGMDTAGSLHDDFDCPPV